MSHSSIQYSTKTIYTLCAEKNETNISYKTKAILMKFGTPFRCSQISLLLRVHPRICAFCYACKLYRSVCYRSRVQNTGQISEKRLMSDSIHNRSLHKKDWQQHIPWSGWSLYWAKLLDMQDMCRPQSWSTSSSADMSSFIVSSTHSTTHSTAHQCTLQHINALYSTPMHSTAHQCTLQHTNALYSTSMHSTAHQCTLQHINALYSTTMHSTAHQCTLQHNNAQTTSIVKCCYVSSAQIWVIHLSPVLDGVTGTAYLPTFTILNLRWPQSWSSTGWCRPTCSENYGTCWLLLVEWLTKCTYHRFNYHLLCLSVISED